MPGIRIGNQALPQRLGEDMRRFRKGDADRPLLLLVEDHPDTADFLESRLTEHGLAVLVAHRGEEALLLLGKKGRVPDVVVMDVNVPNIPGDRIVAIMRQTTRLADVPVVFMTADSPKRVAYLLDATTVCLEKPLATQRLLEAVDAMLGRF